MLTFESDASFHGSSESGMLGSEIDELVAGLDSIANSEDRHENDDGWGVVSISPDDVDRDALNSRNESVNASEQSFSLSNHGILIVDGVDSSIGIPSELSIPTDLPSLPTDGPLDDIHSHSTIYDGADISPRTRKAYKVASLFLAAASSVGIWSLMRERNSWRSSAERLEQEIQRLEQEATEMKSLLESTSLDQMQPEDSFKLLDNCWVQADVKLGLCAQDTKEYFNDLLFGSLGSKSEHSSQKQSRSSRNRASENTFTSFPLLFGEAVAAESEKLADLLGENREGFIDQSTEMEGAASELSETSLKLREAMATAGDAISSEFREISNDPWTYLTDSAREAMQDASYTAKQGRVGKQGLIDAASAVSSASIAWSDAMEAVGVAVSDKLVKVIDDPVSYIEERASKKN